MPGQFSAVPGAARLEHGNSERQEWGEDVSWVDPNPQFPIPMHQSGWGRRGLGNDRVQLRLGKKARQRVKCLVSLFHHPNPL